MPQHGNLGLTLLAVRSLSTEPEDAEGNAILATPIMAGRATRSLFKSISSFELIVLSRISGSHASDSEDSEDILHKHVEWLSGYLEANSSSCVVVFDVL